VARWYAAGHHGLAHLVTAELFRIIDTLEGAISRISYDRP